MSITLLSVVAVILFVLSMGEIVARWLFGDGRHENEGDEGDRK